MVMERAVTVMMMTAQVMGALLVLEAMAEAGLEKALLLGLWRLASQK